MDDPDAATDMELPEFPEIGPGRVGTVTRQSHFPTGCAWHDNKLMSSLWTPYGEQPIEPEQPGGLGGPPGGGQSGGGPGASGGQDPYGGPDEEIDPEQMREMLARLAATPVEAIVTQFVVQLQEIAVLHLGISQERPESLHQAALAIDAFGALVEGLGSRLEPNADALAQVLAQLRLAFVEVSGQDEVSGPGEVSSPGEAAEPPPGP